MKNIFLGLALCCSVAMLQAQESEKDNIHMFPQAKEGYVRHVIEVPKTDNDYAHKIALSIGKMDWVDCNHKQLFADIKKKTVKGWGYSYLEVDNINAGMSTMMMCQEPKEQGFIAFHDILRRYNSRLPLVVYAPQGYEVRYHIWSAGKTEYKAQAR
ncbi:MAG: ecotin [Sulfurovum sp.]|nr:ecotin [Sulfurovum sp.]